MDITTTVRPIQYREDALILLDQTRLPTEVTHRRCTQVGEVAQAIKDMIVRGAPAIGIAAAYGMVLAVKGQPKEGDLNERLEEAAQLLEATRPTAVNLRWAVRRMVRVGLQYNHAAQGLEEALLKEAHAIAEEDRRMCLAMSLAGLELVPKEATLLTHCNAGALATGGIGTALGLVRAAHAAGRLVRLYANETRPFLQGARLTAWECCQDGIPVTLQPDVAAASLIRSGQVNLIVVGADRIAANGDTANKVGTLGLALMAKACQVPLVVVAPSTTVDLSCPDGAAIPIEERPAHEVTVWAGSRIAPCDVQVRNPGFDVTPGEDITAIVTEGGVIRPPFEAGLRLAAKTQSTNR